MLSWATWITCPWLRPWATFVEDADWRIGGGVFAVGTHAGHKDVVVVDDVVAGDVVFVVVVVYVVGVLAVGAHASRIDVVVIVVRVVANDVVIVYVFAVRPEAGDRFDVHVVVVDDDSDGALAIVVHYRCGYSC